MKSQRWKEIKEKEVRKKERKRAISRQNCASEIPKIKGECPRPDAEKVGVECDEGRGGEERRDARRG